MKSIAFVTQKGGAGKSTLATSVAVVAHEAGERVCLIDLDPQASLSTWGKTRGKSDVPVISATATKLPAVLAALADKGVTLAIFDTPGSEGPAAYAAMSAAQLCVIPSRPTAFDLWASANTRKTLKDLKAEYAFVLNQCPPAQQNQRVEEGMKALEAMGALMSPLVHARVDYQEAARRGWGVTEWNAAGAAADEMRGLWASLKKRLAKGSRAATRKAA
jgi:chromosome partitioning protein